MSDDYKIPVLSTEEYMAKLRERMAEAIYYACFTPQYQGGISTDGKVWGPEPCKWADEPPSRKAIVYKHIDLIFSVVGPVIWAATDRIKELEATIEAMKPYLREDPESL